MAKIFTKEELSKYDGTSGLPILIACDGKVYDMTESYHWRGGKHHAFHEAGQDMTEFKTNAPHGFHLLEKFPIVGFYK